MATVSNDIDNTIISGTNEADSLGNGNSNVTIYGYEGNDTIYSVSRIISSGGVSTKVARDSVSIDAGLGDDYIRYDGGNYLSINAGDGNDTLSLHDNSYVSVDLGDGNNQLASFDEDNVTITAGNGIDRIDFSGNNIIINAGADDDEIAHYDDNSTSYFIKTDPANLSYGSNITINAGVGNDTVLVGNNDVVLYSEGDGNDVIGGYYANDTIKIDSTSTPSTVASGSDIIINVGSGSIRLVNATDTAITAVNASGDVINFSAESTPSTETNTSTITSGWATITSSNGSTIIDYDNNFANGTDNADTIQASAISNTVRVVYGNGGDDVVSVEGSPNGIEFSNVTLEGGEGNDAININGTIDGIHPSTVSIGSGGGNDTVNIYGGNEGIHGGTTEITDKSSVSIDLGDGDDQIFIQGANDKGIDISNVNITAGTGNDLISIYGGNYGIGGVDGVGYATVSIDGGVGVDTISVNSINGLSDVSIVAGSGDNISVGSGSANYLFNSTDAVTINGATFKANSADSSANLVSYAEGTSIGSEWNGTVALSGTNSLADIDGSIVSAAGNYQIVDGKFAGTVEPAITPVINPNGKNYDIVFIIDISGSMDYYIDDVKNNVNSFVTKLQNSGVGNVRFGLISYETDASAQIFSNETYLTSDINEFKSAIDNLSTYGGTEYGLTAVELAMSIVSDEDNTTKRFLVVTDEDCDDSSMFNPTNIDNTLKSRGIIMDVVGSEGSCRTEWEPLANATNGKFYPLGTGFPSIFSDITTDIVNVIDLNLVPENQTGYFIATQNSDTYTTPIFQTTGATGNDTAVGAVNEVYIYVADSDTDRQQTVIIPENWNVTATNNDDKLVINGVSATVTGAEGSDVFSLGSDTRTVTLMDLNIDEDKLSFGNYITPGTMRHSIEDNHLVLSADDLRVDIPAMSEMTDEFLDYTVSNAGNSATISELINGDGKAIISFAHWSFTFTQSSLEHFGF